MILHTIEKSEGKAAERKTARGKCIVYNCRRLAGKGRHVCNTCRDRQWRTTHPEHHLWANLKKSAKKRGVEFTLTVAEFKAFCLDNNFVAKVGRGPEDATVDRRDPNLGYTKDNLRVLTFAENAALGRPLAYSGHRNKGQAYLNLETAAPPAPQIVPADPDEPAF